MTEKVSLNLYDLSGGMAKRMSKMIIGKQIDGLWHTGVVVYGKVFINLKKGILFWRRNLSRMASTDPLWCSS